MRHGDMTQKITRFLERVTEVDNESQLQTLVEHFCDIYDLEHAVYHAVSATGKPSVAFTYGLEWAVQYEQQEYWRDDPVIRGAYTSFAPLDWKRLDWTTKRSQQFLGEALSSGVGNQGYTVPIRAPGGQFAAFSANHKSNDDRWKMFRSDYKSDVLLAAHYIHQRAMDLALTDPIPQLPDLSPREKDVLSLLGVGKSRGQIAERLHISEHTLRVYIDTARHKMGALNTTHAVALAFKSGKIVL